MPSVRCFRRGVAGCVAAACLAGCSAVPMAPGGSNANTSASAAPAPGNTLSLPALPAPKHACEAGTCGLRAAGIAASAQRACAVSDDGRVACWGSSNQPPAHHGALLALQLVPDLAAVVEVAVGQTHSCARDARGQVSCWGAPHLGVLGNAGSLATVARPEPVVDLADAAQIVSSGQRNCARRLSGSVWCWGGSVSTPELTSDVPRPVGIEDAVDVAVGPDHGCAVRSNGRVACWGNNAWGQVGGDFSGVTPRPAEVRGVEHAVRVAAGDAHTCILKRTGRVACWGTSEEAVLGRGQAAGPETVQEIGALAAIEALALGRGFSCALRAGRVLCWGRNDHGQLGRSASGPDSTPREVTGIRDAVEIAAGADFACARRDNATISCWGSSAQNQLGQGVAHAAHAFTEPVPVIGFERPARDAWADQPFMDPAPAPRLTKGCPLTLPQSARSCKPFFTTCGCRYLCTSARHHAQCAQACSEPLPTAPECGLVEGRCAEVTQVPGDRCADAPPLLLGGATWKTDSAHDDYGGSCGGMGGPDAVYTLDVARPSLFDLSGAGVAYVRRSCDAPTTEVACARSSEREKELSTLLRPGRYFVFVDGICGGQSSEMVSGQYFTAGVFDVSSVVDHWLGAPMLESGKAVSGNPIGRQGLFRSPCAGAFAGGELVYRLAVDETTRIRFTLHSAAPAVLHVRRDWAGQARDAFCMGPESPASDRIFEAGRYFAVVNAAAPFELRADFSG